MSTSHQPVMLLGDCPRCGDRLQMYHSHNKRRPVHFLGCLSYPRCSYTAPYDDRIDALLMHMQARLARVEAQYAWLLIQVETLSARRQEVTP